MSIARKIVEQLGAGTLFMLGAKGSVETVFDDRGIMFKIKGTPKINRISIVLDPDDTYTMSFIWARPARAPWVGGTTYTARKVVHGLHADQLHEIIESTTGLATRMPNVRFA